ncbi:MAG: FtsW/RodA/SpoVE family cell cycle protein, partial [Ginsengibacter sp.]
MTNSGSWLKNRNAERTCLLLTGLIMAFLFSKMFSVLQRDFAEVKTRLANGTMINLNDDKPGERMKEVLEKGMYFEDPKDISFIATTVAAAKKRGTEINNAGTLNKAHYLVNADEAFSQGGVSFKKRVELSRDLLGFSKDDSMSFTKEMQHPMQVAAQTGVGLGTGTISGTVKNHSDHPVQGALLRLRLLVPQDNTDAFGDDDNDIIQFKNGVRKVLYRDTTKKLQLLSFNAYARTDAAGNFLFSGLPVNKSYDLLPLQPGYEFGPSKGVEKLDGSAAFHFVQSPHTLKLFSTQDFNNLKKEKAFIVRTPEEVTYWFRIIVITFFASFLLLHLLLSIRSPGADQLLLPLLMILTGLSFIALFSLQDPLRDRFLVKSSFIYFCIVMCAIAAFQFINLKKFTPDSGFFRLFIFKNERSAANGWPWAVAAMGLLGLTILFGTGPEGSGV